MQFIVHEGIHSKQSLDWYCQEKGAQAEDAREVLSVGIKFYGTPSGRGPAEWQKEIMDALEQGKLPY